MRYESMTKKKVALSVDNEILKIAKNEIPNLSVFFEECLRSYLGIGNGIYPSAEASDLIQTISKSQAKLHILNERNKVEEKIVKIQNEKLNRIWRLIWNDYKRRLSMNPTMTKEATEVLEVDAETLEDILDFAYVNQDELDLNFTWEEIYEKYRREEGD